MIFQTSCLHISKSKADHLSPLRKKEYLQLVTCGNSSANRISDTVHTVSESLRQPVSLAPLDLIQQNFRWWFVCLFLTSIALYMNDF